MKPLPFPQNGPSIVSPDVDPSLFPPPPPPVHLSPEMSHEPLGAVGTKKDQAPSTGQQITTSLSSGHVSLLFGQKLILASLYQTPGG